MELKNGVVSGWIGRLGFRLVALMVCIALLAGLSGQFVPLAAAQTGASATFGDFVCTVDDGIVGIRFGLDIVGAVGDQFVIAAWPLSEETDGYLNSAEARYASEEGYLGVASQVTLKYGSAHWDAYQLLLPESAFPAGNYTYYIEVEVFDAAMNGVAWYFATECSLTHGYTDLMTCVAQCSSLTDAAQWEACTTPCFSDESIVAGSLDSDVTSPDDAVATVDDSEDDELAPSLDDDVATPDNSAEFGDFDCTVEDGTVYIRFALDIYGEVGQQFKVAAWPLTDMNTLIVSLDTGYMDSSGYIVTSDRVSLPYAGSHWDAFQLTIPESAFYSGVYYSMVLVFDENDAEIARYTGRGCRLVLGYEAQKACAQECNEIEDDASWQTCTQACLTIPLNGSTGTSSVDSFFNGPYEFGNTSGTTGVYGGAIEAVDDFFSGPFDFSSGAGTSGSTTDPWVASTPTPADCISMQSSLDHSISMRDSLLEQSDYYNAQLDAGNTSGSAMEIMRQGQISQLNQTISDLQSQIRLYCN